MKISSLQENFKKGLMIVGRIAGKNINLPILNNILIETTENNIKLTATDLEIGIVCCVRGKKEEAGSFTVDAKLILDYVSLLPNKKMEMLKEGERLKVRCDNYKTIINGQNAEEFPLIPQIDKTEGIRVGIKQIKKALGQVAFAASTSETRVELSGVLFNIEKKELTLAATDSYRLAERKIEIKSNNKDAKIIVPLKTIQEFLRIISLVDGGEINKEEDEVKIYFSPNQIMFEIGNIELTSRLIEGQYPDYEQIIPKNFETRSVVDRGELTRAVKTSAIFSRSGIDDVNFDFPMGKNKIIITSASGQTGENTTELEAKTTGKDNGIVMNYKYILDGLNSLGGDNLIIEMTDNNTPCVLKQEKEENYLYIVMPIKQ